MSFITRDVLGKAPKENPRDSIVRATRTSAQKKADLVESLVTDRSLKLGKTISMNNPQVPKVQREKLRTDERERVALSDPNERWLKLVDRANETLGVAV